MKETKQPRDWKFCSTCDIPYGFINCRITRKGRNICLKCAGEEDKNRNL